MTMASSSFPRFRRRLLLLLQPSTLICLRAVVFLFFFFFFFYLELVEILLKLSKCFLERVDRGARSWPALARQDDLFFVNQGPQSDLELGFFLKIKRIDLCNATKLDRRE